MSTFSTSQSQVMAFVSPFPTNFFNAAAPARCSVYTRVQMNAKKGFGSKPPPRVPSQSSKRRAAASDRYDQMAAAGMPEYSVWMRLKEVPDAPPGEDGEPEQMPWLPVGCISVPRSSQVSKAIFDAEEDLMQGATRLYPTLQNQARDNIEFGYQLREFDDEEIRIVERESEEGFGGTLRKLFRTLTNPMNTGK